MRSFDFPEPDTSPALEGAVGGRVTRSDLISTHEPTGYSVDFGRNLCFVLGLPFDIIDLDGAEAKVRAAVASRTRLFISTPNTNFVVAALRDSAFRDSVLHSHLSLMDGMPLVWAARLMGIPIPERVSGSDLFERLNRPGSTPMKVYFFGGPPGVAAKACATLNAGDGAMTCVGSDEAGFGSIEDMSSAETIDRINASGADFLVVALGAAKGQAWIEYNLRRLTVPVVSHLGAVVNFVAGKVQRAPAWVQHVGLEWIWRVKEEPHLWRRYAADALTFTKLLVTEILPYPSHGGAAVCSLAGGHAEAVRHSGGLTLRISGVQAGRGLDSLRVLCAGFASYDGCVDLDLGGVTVVSTELVALLSVLGAHRARVNLLFRVAVPAPLGLITGLPSGSEVI